MTTQKHHDYTQRAIVRRTFVMAGAAANTERGREDRGLRLVARQDEAIAKMA